MQEMLYCTEADERREKPIRMADFDFNLCPYSIIFKLKHAFPGKYG